MIDRRELANKSKTIVPFGPDKSRESTGVTHTNDGLIPFRFNNQAGHHSSGTYFKKT